MQSNKTSVPFYYIFFHNKWTVTIAGSLIHLCLGTVYAWSFFQKPIAEQYKWSNSQTVWAFSLAICMLGLAAAWGGVHLNKYGAKKLAFTGGLLYGFGYLVAAYALQIKSLWLLYVGFGLLGGLGLGLAYVTPVATVSKWFTKKQGLATGVVVMGFGLGAVLMSKVLAPWFMQLTHHNLSIVFLYLGSTLLLLLPSLANLLNVPEVATNTNTLNQSFELNWASFKKIINEKYFSLGWLMFMLNIVAGMIFIAFQSPLYQDILKKSASYNTNLSEAVIKNNLQAAGATLIAISSICNGIGRFLWGSISDKIGRVTTFKIIFLLQAAIFTLLIFNHNSTVFFVCVCLILLCYGGGFGVMPSYVKENFGANKMPIVYGLMLTAWSIGGILGPQIVAFLKDNMPNNTSLYSFIIALVLLSVGFICSVQLSKKQLA